MQEEHKAAAPSSVKCAILTISDSRTIETDLSGKIIKNLLENHAHTIIDYSIVKDNKGMIHKKITQLTDNHQVDVIIVNGGTGITKKDVTIETIQPLFEKELTGFSSLFSLVSFKDIGSAALLSRATAGVVNKTIVFCLPGSPKAVELAMNKLILSELGHGVKHVHE